MNQPASVLTMVLERFRPDPNALDEKGETPIFGALRMGSVANVLVLLRAGARSDVKNTSGETPFDIARLQEEKEILIPMLEADGQGIQFDEYLPPALKKR